FKKGFGWYKSNFPTIISKWYKTFLHKQKFVSGEATPYYLFHPLAASRVHQFLPDVKLIVLLRNPVNRAYSHYNHEIRKGTESLSFEEALEKEPARLNGETERLNKDPYYYSHNHQHFSYLSRGIYIDQLKTWMNYFPKDRFLIIKSEDLLKNTQFELNRIYKFLELDPHISDRISYLNRGEYSKLPI